jgi:NADH-quinone oxidoreductase subunit G
MAAKFRQAAKTGSRISVIHAAKDDLLMPLYEQQALAPSEWVAFAIQIAVAVAKQKELAVPAFADEAVVSEAAEKVASSILAGNSGILLGNAAANYPDASVLHSVCAWIAEHADAKFGYLTEAANSVGGYVAGAYPQKTAEAVFSNAKKAYIVLHAEPEADVALAGKAKQALAAADMVVVMSPFKHGLEYADVLLPVSPFSETSGTFVSAEGRAQSFHAVVKPLAETRPAWKVLRVLGNLLGLSGFDFETSEAVRDAVLTDGWKSKLSNKTDYFVAEQVQVSGSSTLVAEPGIYSSDAIVRRAESLQLTADAKAPLLRVSVEVAASAGISDGDKVKVSQGSSTVLATAKVDSALAAGVVRVMAGTSSTTDLNGYFGQVSLERA